jgi:hypothetical protein
MYTWRLKRGERGVPIAIGIAAVAALKLRELNI